jgi:hypothetical protein
LINANLPGITTVSSSFEAKKEEKKDNDDGDDAADEDADADGDSGGDGAVAAEEWRVRTVLYSVSRNPP